MVSEHKRYIRDIRSKADKQQGRFDNSGWLQTPEPEVKAEFTTADSNMKVMCPFCLYPDKLSAFFISNSKGISQGKAQCPECHITMMMKSLIMDVDAEGYAKWVFNYRKDGFWQKCPFATWKKRLHNIGWSTAFWAKYKALKGTDDVDSIFSQGEQAAEDYEEAYKTYSEGQ